MTADMVIKLIIAMVIGCAIIVGMWCDEGRK